VILVALFGIAVGETIIAALTARVLDVRRTLGSVVPAVITIAAGVTWPVLLAMREPGAGVAWLVWTLGTLGFARVVYQGGIHRVRAWLLVNMYLLMLMAGFLVTKLLLLARFV
jgi:hypothetical protein